MYQRINGRDWRNIWLMGDLHGCFAPVSYTHLKKNRPCRTTAVAVFWLAAPTFPGIIRPHWPQTGKADALNYSYLSLIHI